MKTISRNSSILQKNMVIIDQGGNINDHVYRQVMTHDQYVIEDILYCSDTGAEVRAFDLTKNCTTYLKIKFIR